MTKMNREWIEIEKELPPLYTGILVTDGEIIVTAERWPNHSERLEWTGYGFEGWDWEFDFDEKTISHWMPLPELPKQK